MLSINREPKYKNKYLLSTLAVCAGFVVTVGIISVVNPLLPNTQQSNQTTNDRRASSLIPINASNSEKSPESDKSAPSSSVSVPAAEKPTSSTQWAAPSQNSSSATAKPIANGTSSTADAPTTNPTTESGGTILDPVTCKLLTLCP